MLLSDMKLIVWDLDETFWKGTISEECVRLIPEHIRFVEDTTDIGIINSICSKNEFHVVKEYLESVDLWKYFVFSSIDWTSKGPRIKDIIDRMKLRYENVLFIDDNVQNLEEAKFYCPGIKVCFPEDITTLIEQTKKSAKKDLKHTRLKQYKQLEEKENARIEFSSNEDFLKSCEIKVEICLDCENEIERIHELILRSNQLNYTKFRQDKDELALLIKDENIKSGYVKVKDKFGDYGTVGFFAIKDNKAIHFLFSCRTLGMQIEQYVYSELGYPEVIVVGETAHNLNYGKKPIWINCNCNKIEKIETTVNRRKKNILFKGPCDMSQMYAFLNFGESDVVTEFTYTNNEGISIEGHNHTSQIVTALFSDNKRKEEIISDFSFFDTDMLTTAIETQKFDFIVLSMLTDGNLGVYERKSTGEQIALCEKKYSLSNVNNHEKYIAGEYFTSSISFSKDLLDRFKDKYTYVDNSNAELTITNLQKIWEYIEKETKIILLLGSERNFKKFYKESYVDRHLEHASMNAKIYEWASDKPNVILIPFDRYIKNDLDFTDTINHFVKRVYYDLACDLSQIFSDKDEMISVKDRRFLLKASLRQKLQIMKKYLIRKK